jgi:hypothetical protein
VASRLLIERASTSPLRGNGASCVLCLGFSKKLENLRYAVSLYFAWSNFVRVDATIKTTPAMASGLTDHVWTIQELSTH